MDLTALFILKIYQNGERVILYFEKKKPSGVPKEIQNIDKGKDNTFNKKYNYFKKLIKNKYKNSLEKDILIYNIFTKISNKLKINII